MMQIFIILGEKKKKEKEEKKRKKEGNKEKKLECGKCHKVLGNKDTLKRHLIEVHNPQPWHCAICGEQLKSIHNRKQHLIEVHLKSIHNRKQHLIEVHLKKSHICDIFTGAFGNKHNLKHHKRKVHGWIEEEKSKA